MIEAKAAQLPQELIEARIFESKPIAQSLWSVWLKAEKPLPDFDSGNFCMLSFPDQVDPLTPRPFAIVERKDERYHFIYRVTGKFTRFLATLPQGTRVNLLGPLGRGFSSQHFSEKKHVFISGGVLTTNDNAIGRDGYHEGHIIGPTIEDHVLVGVGALLLPGVVIGTGSIIGAGAVVTRDVQPGTVVMGVPARFIRRVEEL